MTSTPPTPDVLPPPYALGVPARFDRWRHLQSQAIVAAISSSKRFVVQAMPTGSGKSLVYMAQAGLTAARTVILTSTKGLQEQLTRDFGESGLVDVRGMNNYPCRLLAPDTNPSAPVRHGFGGRPPDTSCDHGPCTVGEKCVFKDGGCGYYDAVRGAQASRLVVTNYSYWMHNQSHGGPRWNLGAFDLLVLDEAHDAPDNLNDFLTVEIEAREVEVMLDTRLLDPAVAPDQWAEWARYHAARVKSKVEEFTEEIKEYSERGERAPASLRREAREWKNLLGKLERLAEMKADWIAEPVGRGMKFSPVWPAGYAERYLFKSIPKVVLVSATIRPKTAEYLGIPRDDLAFHEYPSTFPVARRPFIHVPTVQMNYRTEQDVAYMRQLVTRVDQILAARPDRKGIIHTVSYKRATFLWQNSEHAHRMIRPTSESTRRSVEEFKRARPGVVLISPAVTTGYDFPYDECEYQVIVKLPIPDTRPAIIKARAESDPLYSPYLTMQTLVQMVGRGMRAADDQCETFILDNNVQWWLWKYKAFAPEWFMESYRQTATLPPVMSKLAFAKER